MKKGKKAKEPEPVTNKGDDCLSFEQIDKLMREPTSVDSTKCTGR